MPAAPTDALRCARSSIKRFHLLLLTLVQIATESFAAVHSPDCTLLIHIHLLRMIAASSAACQSMLAPHVNRS